MIFCARPTGAVPEHRKANHTVDQLYDVCCGRSLRRTRLLLLWHDFTNVAKHTATAVPDLKSQACMSAGLAEQSGGRCGFFGWALGPGRGERGASRTEGEVEPTRDGN